MSGSPSWPPSRVRPWCREGHSYGRSDPDERKRLRESCRLLAYQQPSADASVGANACRWANRFLQANRQPARLRGFLLPLPLRTGSDPVLARESNRVAAVPAAAGVVMAGRHESSNGSGGLPDAIAAIPKLLQDRHEKRSRQPSLGDVPICSPKDAEKQYLPAYKD
jgi:hypothetical protein